MSALCMAGDLRDAVIAAVNISAPVSCCDDADNVLFFDASFFYGEFKTLFGIIAPPPVGIIIVDLIFPS